MSSGNPTRKRDRIRGFFGKPDKQIMVANSEPTTTYRAEAGIASSQSKPQTLTAPFPQPQNLSKEFYDAALANLESNDRLLIEKHVTSNINNAVEAAYDAATRQQRICEDNGWMGSNKADKILLWLDRFKSVGGVAANADSIHVGLPWAGICGLFEEIVTDSQQMVALMDGMDFVLSVSHRLQAYYAYFSRLSQCVTTEGFWKALVALYAHLLRFLAQALRVHSANTVAPKCTALWQKSDLIDFEEQCDKLSDTLEREARYCDRELQAKALADAAQWKIDLETTLRKLGDMRILKESFASLQVSFDLSKLFRVSKALYNSTSEAELSTCLDGTRSDILHNIARWAEDPNSKLIFWLCGKAGTGKSTISRTIAHSFHKKQLLGASFFFKRGEENRSNADHFFSTIAAQLADHFPSMGQQISIALKNDSFLCDRGLQEQFEKLLLQPLRSLDSAHVPQKNIVIVIDALDECERHTNFRLFIRLLAQLHDGVALRLRILMTSRPDFPIRLGFQRLNGHSHEKILLEVIQEATIGMDIRAFLKHEFAEMKETRLLEQPGDPLPEFWPSDEDLEILVRLAVPLFIFASTVCRFVAELNPEKRLKLILAQRHCAGSSQLAKMYQPILDQLLIEMSEQERKNLYLDFRRLLGPIILAADPLSVRSLSRLLDLDKSEISSTLQKLHSVLYVPPGLNEPIRLLHQSFRDYLTDQKRRYEDGFWIDETETHRWLADRCLLRLQEPGTLKRDICDVKQPGFRRAALTSREIMAWIPDDVAYACTYWPWHLVKSRDRLHDDSQAYYFLCQYFLYWLEALSWLGKLTVAISLVNDLQSVAKSEDCRKVAAFLTDAKRFILSHRIAIDLAPLQTYHSALIFTPKRSLVLNMFQAEFPTTWGLLPNTPLDWNRETLKFEGHEADVEAISFSQDGRTLASVSMFGVLRLWDTHSGEEKLKIHSGHVEAITFPLDKGTVASVSTHEFGVRLQLWDVETGEQVQDSGPIAVLSPADVAISAGGQSIAMRKLNSEIELFEIETRRLTCLSTGSKLLTTAICLSPDGQILTLGFADGTIQFWDVKSSELMYDFSCHHEAEISEMVFSFTGKTLASASYDGNIVLWDVHAGEQLHILEEQNGSLTAIAFSYDDRKISSAPDGQHIQLWDVETGSKAFNIATNEHNCNRVPLVSMSPAGQILAVLTHDSIVQLWNLESSERIQELEWCVSKISIIAFSPDGSTIVAVSCDIARVWDVGTGNLMQVFELQEILEHRLPITAMCFSRDGQLLAFARAGRLFELWHVESSQQAQRFNTWHCGVGDIQKIVFSRDGEYITTYTSCFDAYVWNFRTFETLYSNTNQIPRRILPQTVYPMARRNSVMRVNFSPEGEILAISSFEGIIVLWDVIKNSLMRKYKGHDDEIATIAVTQRGNAVASASRDGKLNLWDVKTSSLISECAQEIFEHRNFGSSDMIFSPDGKLLALSSGKMVKVLDWQVQRELLTLKEYEDCPFYERLLALSPGCHTLAVSLGQNVELWNLDTGEQMAIFEAHNDFIKALAFSPDGHLATASPDQTVRMWRSTQTSSDAQEIRETDGCLPGFILFPSGKFCISVDYGGTRLWDVQTGQIIRVFEKTHQVAAVSPDELFLVAKNGNALQIWDVQTGQSMQRLQDDDEPYMDRHMEFSPNGQFIALASLHHGFKLWEARTGRQRKWWKSEEVSGDALAVAFSSDEQIVALLSTKIVLLSNVQTCETIQTIDKWLDNRSYFVWRRTRTRVPAMKFSPLDQTIVVGVEFEDYCEIRIWNVITGAHIQTIRSPEDIPINIDWPERFERHCRDTIFRISGNGKYLYTFFGVLVLEWTEFGSLKVPLKRKPMLEYAHQWIRHQDRDILYLPFDYRAGFIDMNEDTLALSHMSGGVSFFRLK